MPTEYIEFYWYFTQIKIGPILVYTRSFKSFEQIGANQELSFPTHVTQYLVMMQISSNSDSDISQVQLPFTKLISPCFRVTLGLMRSDIKFLAFVILR